MAIYTYNGTVSIGSSRNPFHSFADIRDKLKVKDRIIFCDGDNQINYRFLPGTNIRENSNYDDLLSAMWNFAGMKVKITMFNEFDWAENTALIRGSAQLTMDCTQMGSDEATFFLGYLPTNELRNKPLEANQVDSTNCFNVIPLKYDASTMKYDFHGLESRRIFVVPTYTYIYRPNDPNGDKPRPYNFGFDKKYSPGYDRSYYSQKDTAYGPQYFIGGSGFYGAGNMGGRGNVYLLTEQSEKPEGYMPKEDYEKYIGILSDASIRELRPDSFSSHTFTMEIEILEINSSADSAMYYYNGTKLIKSTPYYYDGDKVKKCDAYYFDGNKLIKL